MNLFDAFAVLLVVIAVLLGYRSGALPQVGGLIGALIGGGIAVLAVPLLEEPLSNGLTQAIFVHRENCPAAAPEVERALTPTSQGG